MRYWCISFCHSIYTNYNDDSNTRTNTTQCYESNTVHDFQTGIFWYSLTAIRYQTLCNPDPLLAELWLHTTSLLFKKLWDMAMAIL